MSPLLHITTALPTNISRDTRVVSLRAETTAFGNATAVCCFLIPRRESRNVYIKDYQRSRDS